ncbi:LysR family transcriptional regulator [Methylobacterium nodulans]|uniref:Transcriptional regulator, LysR family n=1 Tax=Methylobacterium nodulans (strain LMG 21967 / CNCM I-2342 / ORS 2060) TaxID=460265 RepID=B8IMF9_METNO|nr:LysR family transcriptional regulator [Methylobacterium nodulans]ACL58345.1 transcriptional regulator, LysR family [Methylobacterium nodulans ORS 2060]
MDRFGEMLVFVRAVEDGGFSAAGRSLTMTPSAVSKLIGRLENRLGVTLFHRASRTVTLTAEGEAFYTSALRAIEAIEEAEASVFGGRAAKGTLRIRSMPTFATHQLAPLVPAFRRLHPALRLDFVLSMEPGNLLDGGVDVAIHVGELADSSLVARRFSSTRWIICAAPAYLAARGIPTSLADLAAHECLNFPTTAPWSIWSVRDGPGTLRRLKPAGSVAANQGQMLLAMARAGAGIVRLAEFHIVGDLRSGRLVELLPEHHSGAEDPIYALYSSRRYLSQRIRVFLEFLDASFSQGPPAWRRTDAERVAPAAREGQRVTHPGSPGHAGAR